MSLLEWQLRLNSLEKEYFLKLLIQGNLCFFVFLFFLKKIEINGINTVFMQESLCLFYKLH